MGLRELPLYFRSVRTLTADNPRQQHRLDLLEPQIAELTGYYRRVIMATKAGGIGEGRT